ncbi:MAG TPA: aminotransferase class V-fold PLP-dependent enzyme [Acidimicrobiia bacterium]|nr:aminotransferase class V-fold PLP-dependent enzyme [Acidimicrobiia bacterium]
MSLPSHGRSFDDVLAELHARKERDARWRDGRTFGLVYDGGEEVEAVGAAAAALYLHDNALNTIAFPSLGAMQSEVVRITADLLHGDEQVAGFMTSGGTESILMAVLAARERGAQERDIDEPEIVLANTAHAAFHKAAHVFGLQVQSVPVRDDYCADVDAMRAAITRNTVLVVGSAPQYPQGVIDPIADLAAIASDAGANFHVDACMGGYVLPFMERLGYEIPPWDFRVDGVTSMSADLHKLGYTPKGASVILHRTKELRRYQTFAFTDWLGGFYASPNLAGTRPGAPMAAAWAVLQRLGVDGYLDLTRRMLDARDRMVAAVRATPGLTVLVEPEAQILGITADGAAQPGVDVFAIGDALARLGGWYLDRQTPPDTLHATVCAANAPAIDAFAADLATAVDEVGAARTDDRSTSYSTLE